MSNHWYAFYPGDYARDTALLNLTEHGAYRLLLDFYYSTGGPLPCLEQCLRITYAMLEHEQKAVTNVLDKFFEKTESGEWINKRADIEIAKQLEKHEKAQEKAKKAAAARWNEDATSNATSIKQAMLGQCQPQPQPQPQPKSEPEPEAEEKRDGATPDKPARPKRKKLSDEEWLRMVKENPAYKGIDVDTLKAKMEAWCITKGKEPTRARLLNWLNREDKPLQPTGKVLAIQASKNASGALARIEELRRAKGEI